MSEATIQSLNVQTDRVEKGEPVKKEMAVSLTEHEGKRDLYIFAKWSQRKGDWTSRDHYRLEEHPTDWEGRSFLLHRDESVREREGPDADEFYAVFISRNLQDDMCTCRGFQGRSVCKHRDAVRGLVQDGKL
jgi:hypothetical protein